MFEGEADESPDWEPGDVVLRIRSRAEKGGWRRKESSLYWKETIGIDEVRAVLRFIYLFRFAHHLVGSPSLTGPARLHA